ncbi:MAG: DUF3105 domain-containing protein [Actinomycetota bacterium]
MGGRTLTLLASAAVAIGACTSSPKPPAPAPTSAVAPASPTSSGSGGAGCTEVQNVGPYDPADENQLHVEQLPPLSTYPSQPPASGPHTATPQPAGVSETPPELGAVIHSLEHGTAVIWYAPSVTAEPGFAAIADLVATDGDHTIMAPYDYPDAGSEGTLPEGTSLALVAWEHVQYCETLDLDAVTAFLSSYRAPPLGGGDYIGNAPEAGVPI